MMWGDGYGVSRPDLYVTSLMDFHRNWRNRANELSETDQALHHVRHLHPRFHGSRYYGKAMNHHAPADRCLRCRRWPNTTCC